MALFNLVVGVEFPQGFELLAEFVNYEIANREGFAMQGILAAARSLYT